MTTTSIVVLGCLTGFLIRHTAAMGGALFASIVYHHMGVDMNYITERFDLYREYQIVIGSLLGSLLYLVILSNIFAHNFKAASLCVIMFCVTTIAIDAVGFDTGPDFSFMSISRSVGMGIGAIVVTRIAIKKHSSIEPIAIYHKWRYINRPEDWLHVLWALVLTSVWISYQYLFHPSRIERTFILDYPVTLIVLHVLSLVILLPFVEELVFRRLFFSALRQQTGLPKATLISSLIFSLIHMDPTRLVPAFIAGVALALIYERTQSLIVCTAVHGFMNALIYLATDILAGSLGP